MNPFPEIMVENQLQKGSSLKIMVYEYYMYFTTQIISFI